MNWLFVTTRFPWPIVDGHWLRVYHLVRTLAAEGDRVAILTFAAGEAGIGAYAEIGVDLLPSVPGEHAAKGPGRCLLAPYAFDARLAQALAEHARQFESVVLSGARMMHYAPEAAAAGHVVADLIDDPVLEYRRRGDPPASLLGLARRLKNRFGRLRYERMCLKHIAATTFVSDADCQSFRERHPHASVVCVPNGVDAAYFCPPGSRSVHQPSQTAVVFTGHMSNPNNERAAAFLVRQVAPLVWTQRPETRFQIVGADPTASVLALSADRVQVTGRVDDIRPYLWDAASVAIPMQSGTGVKNKLLEAWAAGAAVVATPLACQGVPARDGHNLLVADRPQEFARHLVSLLDNVSLRASVSAQGHRTVLEGFTWSAAAERLRRCASPAKAVLSRL